MAGLSLQKESQMPLILLVDDANRLFSLPVGPFEANSIIVEAEGIKVPRPLTHDLFVAFLKRHGFKIKYMEIYGVEEEKFLARVIYRKGIMSFSMDIRPSDGIALAIRLGFSIFIDDKLLSFGLIRNGGTESIDAFHGDILYFGHESSSVQHM